MLWHERLYLQDAIDARRDTVVATKQEIRKKVNAQISWSYALTEEICRKSPGQGVAGRQLLAAVDRIQHEVARRNNKAATSLLHPYFSRLEGRFYKVEKERFRIGVNVTCQIRMLGLLHNGNNGDLYWVQYRKTGALTREEMGIVCTVGLFAYLDDPEYKDFGLRMLDVGAGETGIRRLREFDICNLRIWPVNELNEFFEPVFHAVKELKEEGFQPDKRKKPQRQPSVNQPDFFK